MQCDVYVGDGMGIGWDGMRRDADEMGMAWEWDEMGKEMGWCGKGMG